MIKKNANLFHGTGCTSDSYWFPYLKRELERESYKVWTPDLPNTDEADIKKWLPVALKGTYTPQTVIVGHSAGSPLILSVLERIHTLIYKAVLVAGYAKQREGSEKPDAILQTTYNWKKIRKNVKEIFFVNSDNDPWKCDDKQGRYMFDRLGGIQIILHGEGHMGSDAFKQPYKKFPLLVKLIE